MNQEKIGKFIAKCRKDKKITQEQLAEKLGVSNKSISRWENGKNMPDYSILKELCNTLDIDVNEFLSGEKIEKNEIQTHSIENLDLILKEYYKMKKQRNIIKTTLIVISVLFALLIVRTVMLFGIIGLLTSTKNISGIEKYDKSYFIKEYGGDLDSNLSIFPNDKSILKEANFSSSFQTNLFDSYGFIILKSKYNKENFESEIDRIKKLNATIYESCKDNAKKYTNYVKYDSKSYHYPAYITIDGFRYTYEYALINEKDLEITYVYLSYPSKNNSNYEDYLKIDRSIYSSSDTLGMYSMYNHSFDNGNSFVEIGDCGRAED